MMMAEDHTVAGLTQSGIFQKVSGICSLANSILKTEELLDVSLRQMMGLFGANRGSIFIFDLSRNELILKASSGLRLSETNQLAKKLGQGIVGLVAKEKKPIIVDNIESDSRFENFKARKAYSSGAFICVPMILKDELIGVINVSDKITGNTFMDEELQLLDFLGSQLALNYQRIMLYAKFTDVMKESQALRDQLGESGREKEYLKRQVDIQDRLATIGKLAGGIAHEFNNPLDGVMRYTNLCLQYVPQEDVAYGYLMEIQQGLRRMANIVKNLLACSRNEFIATSRINIGAMIQRSLGVLKGEFESRGIELNLEIEKELPPIVDLGIERVFGNLVRNALDAIEKNGVMTISVQMDSQDLVLKVRDSGRGISAEMMDQIFEPFFTTKDIDKGCGLGLTIVGEVVKAYDGHIDVESRLNEGTEFTVRLPKQRVL